jgi:hypothetical protein
MQPAPGHHTGVRLCSPRFGDVHFLKRFQRLKPSAIRVRPEGARCQPLVSLVLLLVPRSSSVTRYQHEDAALNDTASAASSRAAATLNCLISTASICLFARVAASCGGSPIASKGSKNLALGASPEVTLAEARDRREAARKLLANGKDPSLVKMARAAGGNSFREVAEELLER